jgi:Leucine-rich repeat (LRR) protein
MSSHNVHKRPKAGKNDCHDKDVKERDEKEEEEINMEKMQAPSMDMLKQYAKRDPPTVPGAVDAAVATTTTSGHSDADSIASYTLTSGNLVDAKNSLRSYSVAATAEHNVMAAAPLGRGEGVTPNYKDQVRSCTATYATRALVQTERRYLVPNVTLGDNQKQLRFTDSSGQVILPQTGPVNVLSHQLPVYKEQANSEEGTDNNPNAEQDLVPDSHGQSIDGNSVHGAGVSYKDTPGAVAVAPSRRTLLDPSNATSPTTEVQEHLLVATVVPDSVVHEGSSDSSVVTAVPLTGRYWKVLAGVSFIVLVIGAVGVCTSGACSSSSPTSMPPSGSSPTPTMSPAVSRRAEQLTTFINNVTLTGRTIAVSPVSNDTSLGPEGLALHWLIDYDTDVNLLPDTPTSRFRLQQRYALATLQVQEDTSNAFFGSLGNECEWDGVTCQSVNLGDDIGIQQAVTTVIIDTNNNGNVWTCQLSADLGLLPTLIHFNMSTGYDAGTGGVYGTLPSQIGQLINLQTLDVSNNELTGSLPTEIGQLINLQTLDAYGNQLTGSLPTEIGELANLQYFDVSWNQLTGSLPTQIGKFTNLTYLNVAGNVLTGSLPSQIGQMTNLQNFDMSNNRPTGTLAVNPLMGSFPTQIGQMVNLQRLIAYHNAISGSLPSQIGRLTNLKTFDVSSNALSGSLPSQIGQLTNLTNWLDVSDNKLSGSLPSQIGELTNLQILDVHTNALTGTFPTQIGQMTKLKALDLHGNTLNGTMPENVCLLRNQSLTILAADCSSEVSCNESCCTACS